MRTTFVIILTTVMLLGNCTKHEEDREPIQHRALDSTTYFIHNRLNQKVCIVVSEHIFFDSGTTIEIQAHETAELSVAEFGMFPGIPFYPGSCSFTYEDGVSINYLLADYDWDKLPILPRDGIDSLYMHYPFRHSNCIMTVSNTNEGKQKITCEYEITEDDYEFAKNN